MPERRDKSISSKVTTTEYEACQRAAGALSVSEWNRALVLRELERIDRKPIDELLLEELVALRYIVLNGLPVVVSNATRAAVADTIDGLRAEADRMKVKKARVLLEGTR